jgi:hypothetical protein
MFEQALKTKSTMVYQPANQRRWEIRLLPSVGSWMFYRTTPWCLGNGLVRCDSGWTPLRFAAAGAFERKFNDSFFIPYKEKRLKNSSTTIRAARRLEPTSQK